MKEKTNMCAKCYVTIKKYTIIRGIVISILLQICMMIPIINLLMLGCFVEEERKEKNIKFWQGCWYDIKKIQVKKTK